jgi:hypothetical protein
MTETNPELTDTQVEDLFKDDTEVGSEDVQGKSEVETLTLDELNELAGRKDNPFKSKEEFTKHYGNLKSFVGKKQETKKDDLSAKEEIANLKKEIAYKDEVNAFISNTPTAKNVLPIVEAYAEKKGISLSEAWASEEFKNFAESSQRRKEIVTNNRISPLQSKNIQELANQAKTGSESAKNELVHEWFGKK